MEITSVNITPLSPAKKGLVAFCSVELDKCLTLDSIGIYSRLDGTGFRLTTPCRKIRSGKLYPYFKFTPEFQQKVLEAITEEIKALHLFEFRIASKERQEHKWWSIPEAIEDWKTKRGYPTEVSSSEEQHEKKITP